MSILLDAVTEAVRTATTNPYTISHGGAAGGVQAVAVAIINYSNSADVVYGVTYGGEPMGRVVSKDNTYFADWWFLGHDVPAGTQDVVVTFSGATTNDYHIVVLTFTADGDCEVIDADISTATQNPQVTLSAQGLSSMALAAIASSHNAPTDLTLLSDMTAVHDNTTGAASQRVDRQTTVSTSDFTIGYTTGGVEVNTLVAFNFTDESPIKLVQKAVGDSGGTTLPATATSGNLLIGWWFNSTSTQATLPSGWTAIQPNSSVNSRAVGMAYKYSDGTETGFAPTGLAADADTACYEFTGLNGSGPLHSSVENSASTKIVDTTVTPGDGKNVLLVGLVGLAGANLQQMYPNDGGFVQYYDNNDLHTGTEVCGATLHRVVNGTSGSYEVGGTYVGTNRLEIAIGAAFEAAATGGTVSGSFTADAYIKRVGQAGSFTADAYLKSTLSGSLTADAYLKATVADSLTADAFIRQTGLAGSFVVDAFIRGTVAGDFTADAYITVLTSGSFTADAYIKRVGLPGSFTADAFVRVAQQGSFTADAFLRTTSEGSFTADAFVRKTASLSFTADAFVQRTFGASFVADAYVRTTSSASFTADAEIAPPEPGTRTGSFTVDAFIRRVGFGGFTADAFIVRTTSESFTADAFIRRTMALSFSADAYVRVLQTGSLVADAFVRRTFPGQFTADAHVRATVASSFTLDAHIHNPSAVRNITGSTSVSVMGRHGATSVLSWSYNEPPCSHCGKRLTSAGHGLTGTTSVSSGD